jgi:hypothetical protein
VAHQSGEIPIIGAELRSLSPADSETDRTVGADLTWGTGGRSESRTLLRGINNGFDGGFGGMAMRGCLSNA